MLKPILPILLISALVFPLMRAVAQDELGVPAGFNPSFAKAQEPAVWSASYTVEEGSTTGQLLISVEIAEGWHVNSMTQAPGGPRPTKVRIKSPSSVKLAGDFVPERSPHESENSEFAGVTLEEYDTQITWTAAIEVPAGFHEPIELFVSGNVCSTPGAPGVPSRCIPIDEKVLASFAAAQSLPATTPQTPATVTPEVAQTPLFRDVEAVVQWRADLVPGEIKPGERAVIKLTAIPDPTFHVYPAAVDDSPFSTNFVVTEKAGLQIGEPTTLQPIKSQLIVPSQPPVEYHEGNVDWELVIEVPADATAGEHVVQGAVVYQACTESSCLPPQALKFVATLNVDSVAMSASSVPISLSTAKVPDTLDAASETKWVDKISPPAKHVIPEPIPETHSAQTESAGQPDSSGQQASTAQRVAEASAGTAVPAHPDAVVKSQTPLSFPIVLLLAFAGGVILNVMPCVLPVVGLKVMSFVSQAGEDRGRVLRLNYAYVLGILSVFALLAGLAVAIALSWGQQFTFFPVRLGLTLVMFALALSYLGVWEIPVPGMASGKASQQLQSREGYVGAFFKGVFTTIMATPCSGPMLGYIFSATLTLSPPQTVLVIMIVGVGMAMPYIIVGLQPQLVSWIPKPGPWMETFKQFLAFLFLATVAFFFATFKDDQRVPVFIALGGVWFGCWIIGLVPNWESLNKRVLAWSGGVAAAVAIGWGGFNLLGPGELKWEPYSEARLRELQAQGRTVMLDFTANWCLNCKLNTAWAIDTVPTREAVEKLNVVPMLADWSEPDERIKTKVTQLESNSIPLLVFYPGKAPNQPIILRDIVSQANVLEALEQAGPSLEDGAGSLISDSPEAIRMGESTPTSFVER